MYRCAHGAGGRSAQAGGGDGLSLRFRWALSAGCSFGRVDCSEKAVNSWCPFATEKTADRGRDSSRFGPHTTAVW
jgi:hypothetical protein